MSTLLKAFKTKDIRQRLLYMAFALLTIRIGSQIPVPGVDRAFLKEWFAEQGPALGLFGTLTGGSFENMSVFALSITPYISSSIILQLLSVAFPALEEIAKDGEEGRRKMTAATRILTIVLAVTESLALCIGFGRQGLIPDVTVLKIVSASAVMTAGSAFLMWLGEQVTEQGLGNGISFILVTNILSKIPQSFIALYEQFMSGKKIPTAVLISIAIAAIVILIVLFVVVLEGGVREIPIRYSRKSGGPGFFDTESASIPLKVNTSGVIAVIFAASFMSLPGMVSAFIGKVNTGTRWDDVLRAMNQAYWFDTSAPVYTLGFVLYAVLVIFFAYYYTSITTNPMLIADSLRKSGGTIPGVRPGEATEAFLKDVLANLILIGGVGLLIVASAPIILAGLFKADVSFGGTSVIIIAGVLIETVREIDAKLAMANCRGFLDTKGGRHV